MGKCSNNGGRLDAALRYSCPASRFDVAVKKGPVAVVDREGYIDDWGGVSETWHDDKLSYRGPTR